MRCLIQRFLTLSCLWITILLVGTLSQADAATKESELTILARAYPCLNTLASCGPGSCTTLTVLAGEPVHFSSTMLAGISTYTFTGTGHPDPIIVAFDQLATTAFASPGVYTASVSSGGPPQATMTIIVQPTPSPWPAPPPGVLYYTFDCATDIYRDQSGKNHEGINGGATVVAGVHAQTAEDWGHGLRFLVNNGPQECWTADAPDLRITGEMSATAWVFTNGPNDSDPADCTEGTIFSKAGDNWFQLKHDNSGLELQNESSGTEPPASVLFPAPLSPGTWHQIGFVRTVGISPTSGDPDFNIWFYLDGQQVGDPQVLNNPPSSNNNGVLAFGNYGYHTTAACELNGYLDEIHIFDTCVSDAFIYDEYRRIHDSVKMLPCPVCDSLAFQLTWGTFGTDPGQFEYPTGVATDNAGDVYVAEQVNNRIQKFSSSGVFEVQWGTFGTGGGQFNRPYGVTADNNGFVYVSDADNNRIERFSNTGAYAGTWGSPGSGNGQFNHPALLATDAAGNVYVADYGNDRIQKFTSAGAFLAKWGSHGTGNGQFIFPTGVAVDANNNVYVTDYNNHRVQEFTNTGIYLSQFGSFGTGPGQFNSPAGIATDQDGNVYVSEIGNQRIQKLSSSGVYMTQWGTGGTNTGEFDAPIGVASDAAGDVFVADSHNHRIQEFGCTGFVLGVSGPPSHAQASIFTRPNPFMQTTRITLSMARAEENASVLVLDVSGRTVQTLHRGPLATGSQYFVWDGRNAQGRQVSSGVYFVAVLGSHTNFVHRVMRLR